MVQRHAKSSSYLANIMNNDELISAQFVSDMLRNKLKKELEE